MKLASINPFSGQVIKEYEQLNDDEIMIKVKNIGYDGEKLT